jgi:hypothetical protein
MYTNNSLCMKIYLFVVDLTTLSVTHNRIERLEDMNNELWRMRKWAAIAWLKVSKIEEIEEKHQRSGRDSNQELLKPKSEILPRQLTSSVKFHVTTQIFIAPSEIYVSIFLEFRNVSWQIGVRKESRY